MMPMDSCQKILTAAVVRASVLAVVTPPQPSSSVCCHQRRHKKSWIGATCHGARSGAIFKRSSRIPVVSCNGVERERPVVVAVVVAVTVAVTVAMFPRSIVNSDPAASAGRRVLSFVNAAEVVGHCL
jgi:hypothetical protein